MLSIKSLLSKYSSNVKSAKKLRFNGIENQDVYNITAPFKIKRTKFIAGRVELRDKEMGSKSVFFKKTKNKEIWNLDWSAPIFNLQDPFLTKIKDMLIFGGVEVNSGRYRTVFYKGSKISNLKKFANGPWGMKDIRLFEFNDKIGVFTRPQGKKGGRGKIGFRFIDSLQELKPRTISRTELIKTKFARGEWGGINDVHIINNKIAVLGHIARFNKNIRYYYPFTALFKNNELLNPKIIATRKDLPKGEAKRKDLYNIIFPGGIKRKKGYAELYCGVSDAEAYRVKISDPFNEDKFK